MAKFMSPERVVRGVARGVRNGVQSHYVCSCWFFRPECRPGRPSEAAGTAGRE